jgi:hypothetical protein
MSLPSRWRTTRVGEKAEEAAAMSSAEENKALVRYFLAETAKGNLDVIDEVVAPDFVDRSV